MARAAGTAQDNATISPDQKRPKGKNPPRFRLPTPENQRPIGATPIGTGVPDAGMAPEMPFVPLERNETPGSSDRRKAGFPNYTTTQTQAGAALPGTRWHRTAKVPGPFDPRQGRGSWTALALSRAKPPVPAIPSPFPALAPPLSFQRAEGPNPSSAEENATCANGRLPASPGSSSAPAETRESTRSLSRASTRRRGANADPFRNTHLLLSSRAVRSACRGAGAVTNPHRL